MDSNKTYNFSLQMTINKCEFILLSLSLISSFFKMRGNIQSDWLCEATGPFLIK